MPIENVKRSDFIVELRPGYSAYKQITAAQVGAFGTKDLSGDNFTFGYSLLTRPFLMVAEEHKHEFDQYVFFMGGDPANIVDFDAEIEMGVAGKIHSITYPACVRIPKGTMHGPLNIKRVTKPLIFIDIVLSTGPSVRPVPPQSQR